MPPPSASHFVLADTSLHCFAMGEENGTFGSSVFLPRAKRGGRWLARDTFLPHSRSEWREVARRAAARRRGRPNRREGHGSSGVIFILLAGGGGIAAWMFSTTKSRDVYTSLFVKRMIRQPHLRK
jgi:hypothetical protein